MSSDQANQAAEAILALINSRPQSPSKEEIAVLIDRIANPHRPAPPDELRSGTAIIAKHRELEREWMHGDGVLDHWRAYLRLDQWTPEKCQWTPEEVQQIKLRQQIKRERIEGCINRIEDCSGRNGR